MVTRVKVELYQVAISEVLQTDVGKFVTDVTLRVLNRAKVLCPVDTGNLRAAHQMRLFRGPDRISGEVFNLVNYALPVHDGRRALTIYPKVRKALAFDWEGEHLVRRSVHQKRRRGRPWLKDALVEVAQQEGMRMAGAGQRFTDTGRGV